MSFPTVCSQCGSSYTFKDEFQGKKIRCKKCQEIFVAIMVEEPAEEIEDDLISKALGLDGAKDELEPSIAQAREPAMAERPAPEQEEMPRPPEKVVLLAGLEEEPVAELVEEPAIPLTAAPKVARALPPRGEKSARKRPIEEDSWEEEEVTGGSAPQGSMILAVLAWTLVFLVVLAGTAPAVYYILYPDKVDEKSPPIQTPMSMGGVGRGATGPRSGPPQGTGLPGMGIKPPTSKQPTSKKTVEK